MAVLLLLVLGAVFISVDRSAYSNTRNTIDANLLTGREVLRAVLGERENSFKSLLISLSRDFGFREAYQVVLVPILIPIVDGWLLMAQRLDTE